MGNAPPFYWMGYCGMSYVDTASCGVLKSGGAPTAPVIYVIDSLEHPFDLSFIQGEIASAVALVPVRSWNDALTPWVADGLYRGEPAFGSCAAKTLAELCRDVVPRLERNAGMRPRARAICGYSLGGLFALYSLVNAPLFDACACLSGSVWYEGWVDYLRRIDVGLAGKFAYLSIGTKEKRAARPILQAVQSNMEDCACILRSKGCDVHYQTGPGNHMQFIRERYLAGVKKLDCFMCSSAS